ncbi:hypothetical protein MKW92_036759 [Papaver armeniacum]|nr:hypothetical protein MKW92_036759 [Papaver armeniacum]
MSIKYRDYLPLNLVVDNFPSLVDVDLCFLNNFRYISDFDLLSKFIMKLSNAHHLRFSTLFINTEILGLVNVLSESVPTFENLIHLQTDYIQANKMIKFLQFTPNLESLVIFQAEVNEDAFTSNIVPRCLLRHLKTIKVQKFEGLPEELQLVKYFLKNARVLQVLVIESGITSKSVAELKKRTKIMQRLLMYPRASKSCKVKFQFPE